MVNTEEIKSKMRESGISYEELATKLGITVSTLYRKLKSGNFIIREAILLAKSLRFTSSDVLRIFFEMNVA